MAADYQYVVNDAASGNPLGVVPFGHVTFTDVINGLGSFTGELPTDHPKAVPSLLRPGGKELTVFRAGQPVWHGPITHVEAHYRGLLRLTAQTFPWYLSRRLVDADKVYTGTDVLAITRDLITLATSAPKVNAALPRFTVDPYTRGQTKDLTIKAVERRGVFDLLRTLAQDASAGPSFEFTTTLSASPAGVVSRNLALPASGALGQSVTAYVLADAQGADFQLTAIEEIERAANVVHVTGGAQQLVQQAGTPAGTDFLLESIVQRYDVVYNGVLSGIAADLARTLAPPIRLYDVAFRPCPAMPYGCANLGDTIRVQEHFGYSAVNAVVRVVASQVDVDDQLEEVVHLTVNSPGSEQPV